MPKPIEEIGSPEIERVFKRFRTLVDRVVVRNDWNDRAVGKLSANPKTMDDDEPADDEKEDDVA